MAKIPIIIMRIVHIEGPLRGEIQEFSDAEISIGRYPECQVRFPKDLLTVSRLHAKITREGNRFKLTNMSEKNLTYLKGNPIQRNEHAYLKSGDWIQFAYGGPKVSFLTKVEEGDFRGDTGNNNNKICPPENQVSLVIRYGFTLRQFKKLPITIGKNPNCDFTLDHPSVFDQHAQFFFSQGHYWVKDLTGQQSVLINGRPINIQAPLNPDNQLSLSRQGPTFHFLGDGRLDEVKE